MTILADNETKIDLLNNDAIAATITKLLRSRPDSPVTIGVHGDWGAGKSSILEMIEADFEKESKALCLKFNGWRFQGFEDAKIALIEGIVSGLLLKRPALAKAGDAVKDILKRIDWLKVAKKAGGLALTILTGIPSFEHIESVVGTIEGLFADPKKLATKENLDAAIDGVRGLLKPDGATARVPDEISGFRKAFDDLLASAGVDQLVVLIDDLDRCLPETAVETLEAVRLFVFTGRTAFVVAADEAMIEYAVRRHFPDLPDTAGSQTYARNYLEKLIQVPFRIPALGEAETRIYVTLLLVGAELGEADESFTKLVAEARERLRRPWKSSGIDLEVLKRCLGEKVTQTQHAVALSEQIGPILAAGTKGNPRQIKRFLNMMVLRSRTAEARGFGDDMKIPVLAKLMLAERFIPRLFDQIAGAAAAASDGKCHDLAALESTVRADSSAAGRDIESSAAHPAAEDHSSGTTPENSALTEWLSSPTVRAWAAVSPNLEAEDLRPYLFVAKDRKDYFGMDSVVGHLAVLVEQMLGPRVSVQGREADVKRLNAAEAAQLFDAVRGHVVGSDSYDFEPSGAAGLSVIVRAHPTLQGKLLDLLEMLPAAKLGPWVCGGWEGVIRDLDSTKRYEQLLQVWGQSGNSALRIAAQGVSRTRKGIR